MGIVSGEHYDYPHASRSGRKYVERTVGYSSRASRAVENILQFDPANRDGCAATLRVLQPEDSLRVARPSDAKQREKGTEKFSQPLIPNHPCPPSEISWAQLGRKTTPGWAQIEESKVSKDSRINRNFADCWSGRWESNPRPKLGKLRRI